MEHVLITGGAGFIGTNMAQFHLKRGDAVYLFDNFSRKGSSDNIAWLKTIPAGSLQVFRGDVRNAEEIDQAVRSCSAVDRVYHLAGQVAVTCSLTDPREDFESNAVGTFNVLEAVRCFAPEAAMVYASTNKVYGALDDVAVDELETRYMFRNLPFGISEEHPVDFHSPYGCSKGAGDQYVRDYARSYGLRAVVFRQSCIYGLRQFGVEDQGWIAHFCIALLRQKPITIFGNGKQVRDILWVDDLVAAYDAACVRMDEVHGEIFNIGGGAENTTSIWCEIAPHLETVTGVKPVVDYRPPRLGDQRIFVSDVRRAGERLGWAPTVGVEDGIGKLWHWISSNRELFV
ncbi:MAG: GDP-mannose 4,6-dehydratase [Kiritimatiellales bacterium]